MATPVLHSGLLPNLIFFSPCGHSTVMPVWADSRGARVRKDGSRYWGTSLLKTQPCRPIMITEQLQGSLVLLIYALAFEG